MNEFTGKSVDVADVEPHIATILFFSPADTLASDNTIWLVKDAQGIPNFSASVNLSIICMVTLKNGYTSIGQSVCNDQKQFDATQARDDAYKDALKNALPIFWYSPKHSIPEKEPAKTEPPKAKCQGGCSSCATSRFDQPAPTPNNHPPLWDLVIADMEERHKVGIQRYGVPLQAHNNRNSIKDAYQEVLDLCVYLRQAIYEADGE